MIATDHETRELSSAGTRYRCRRRTCDPKGSIIIFGYGIQWNDRSICIVTPTQDTIINRPQ